MDVSVTRSSISCRAAMRRRPARRPSTFQKIEQVDIAEDLLAGDLRAPPSSMRIGGAIGQVFGLLQVRRQWTCSSSGCLRISAQRLGVGGDRACQADPFDGVHALHPISRPPVLEARPVKQGRRRFPVGAVRVTRRRSPRRWPPYARRHAPGVAARRPDVPELHGGVGAFTASSSWRIPLTMFAAVFVPRGWSPRYQCTLPTPALTRQEFVSLLAPGDTISSLPPISVTVNDTSSDGARFLLPGIRVPDRRDFSDPSYVRLDDDEATGPAGTAGRRRPSLPAVDHRHLDRVVSRLARWSSSGYSRSAANGRDSNPDGYDPVTGLAIARLLLSC